MWRISIPQYSDRNKQLDAMSAIASEVNIQLNLTLCESGIFVDFDFEFDASVDRP